MRRARRGARGLGCCSRCVAWAAPASPGSSDSGLHEGCFRGAHTSPLKGLQGTRAGVQGLVGPAEAWQQTPPAAPHSSLRWWPLTHPHPSQSREGGQARRLQAGAEPQTPGPWGSHFVPPSTSSSVTWGCVPRLTSPEWRLRNGQTWHLVGPHSTSLWQDPGASSSLESLSSWGGICLIQFWKT